MAELLQPPEGSSSMMMNGVLTVGGVSSDNPGGTTTSKRQRRPSVRLGDIGDQPATISSYESHHRTKQQWNHHHHHHHHHPPPPPPDSSSNKYRHPSSSSSHKDTTTAKASKTRPLTNLSNGGGGAAAAGGDSLETLEPPELNHHHHHHHPSSGGGGGGGGGGDANLDLGITNTAMVGGIGIGNNNRRGGGKDFKNKRGPTKRPRSNWVTKVDQGVAEEEEEEEETGEEKFINGGGGEDGDEWYNNRDFDEADASESPLKEQSPINSLDNIAAMDLRQASDRVHHGNEIGGLFLRQRRPPLVRPTRVVSESRGGGGGGGGGGGDQLDGPSDTDVREFGCRTSVDRNGVSDRGRCSSLEDGVQSWLNGLGLARYAPVFEIHEVDEDVLPLLTLEDLRDMGIQAVGSRRKMYCAIQKLAKGFS